MNSATAGGGVFNRGAEPVFVRCGFEANVAAERGGAIANFQAIFTTEFGFQIPYSSRLMLHNCVLGNNTAMLGGGIYTNTSAAQAINCSIIANSASLGGATFTGLTSTLRIANSIVWDNLGNQFFGPCIARYCNITGGLEGAGNFDADPLFVDLASGDFHLLAGSPCIDAGNNAKVPADLLTDFDGLPRFRNDLGTVDTGAGTAPIVDIGAFEFQRD
jgi:hypothetical protein